MAERIYILGGGFGGLYSAMELEHRLAGNRDIEVTLVNRDNFFLFTPMLHEVAASDLDLTNAATPDLHQEQRCDDYPESVVPGPGGTSLHLVTFPPGAVFADPSFDRDAARREALVRLRGLADHFEDEDPAMHKTNTVDYSIVWEGEMWLELDGGKTIHLKRGDVVIQNGTRHAWRNKGTRPVTMLFFLNGAKE